MTIPDASIGAITAALVAGLVTLLGLVISKENKTSEFRQAWIDGLRSDLANYTAHIVVLLATVRIEGRESDVWVKAKGVVTSLNQSAASIRLRLNPNEAPSSVLLASLDALETAFDKRTDIDAENIVAIEKQLLRDAQCLLKLEWTRVRDGERIFRLTRYASLLAIGVAVAGLAYNTVVHINPPHEASSATEKSGPVQKAPHQVPPPDVK